VQEKGKGRVSLLVELLAVRQNMGRTHRRLEGEGLNYYAVQK